MLDKEKLKNKYGDIKIMTISNDVIAQHISIQQFQNCFLSAEYCKNIFSIFQNAEYQYRYEAEVNSNFKQPIPYVVFYNPASKRYFCMERLQGDERLVGLKSLGVGGHVDNQEDFQAAIFREINEEIQMENGEIESITFKGLILDTSNEVGSVHLGFLYLAYISDENITCKEKDTLKGYFLSLAELETKVHNKEFETWSSIALHECLLKEKP